MEGGVWQSDCSVNICKCVQKYRHGTGRRSRITDHRVKPLLLLLLLETVTCVWRTKHDHRTEDDIVHQNTMITSLAVPENTEMCTTHGIINTQLQPNTKAPFSRSCIQSCACTYTPTFARRTFRFRFYRRDTKLLSSSSDRNCTHARHLRGNLTGLRAAVSGGWVL